MDQGLELNTLDRFRKRSDTLALEEHNSCEVPAGCGGVVLRWVDLAREIPVLFGLYTPGKAEVYLDGEPMQSTSPLVAYGPHLLAIHLRELPEGAVLAMAVRKNLHSRAKQDGLLFATAADGSWTATARAPGDSWAALDFGKAWPPMVERPFLVTPKNHRYFSNVTQGGGVPLAPTLPRRWFGRTDTSQLWVRRPFELQP